MKILLEDTETTGLNKQKDKIIEIGAIYKDTDSGESEEFHRYIKYPEYPDNFQDAVKIHGLSPEVLEEKGIENKEAYNEFIGFMDSKVSKFDKTDKCIVSGYNVVFDIGFVRNFFYANGNRHYGSYFFSMPLEVSTFVMEAVLNGWIPPLENYKLSTIAEHFNLKFEAHSAIEDIKITEKIFQIMVKLRGYANNIEQEFEKIIIKDLKNIARVD